MANMRVSITYRLQSTGRKESLCLPARVQHLSAFIEQVNKHALYSIVVVWHHVHCTCELRHEHAVIISRLHYLIVLYQGGATQLQPSPCVQDWKKLLFLVEILMSMLVVHQTQSIWEYQGPLSLHLVSWLHYIWHSRYRVDIVVKFLC